MIVLRLTLDGAAQDVRSGAQELLIGADPAADISHAHVGWKPREARLIHEGTAVRVERPGLEPLRMGLGDELEIGRARLTLVGLLPLTDGDEPPPLFGDYEDVESRTSSAGFVLADDQAAQVPSTGEPASAGPSSSGHSTHGQPAPTETTSHLPVGASGNHRTSHDHQPSVARTGSPPTGPTPPPPPEKTVTNSARPDSQVPSRAKTATTQATVERRTKASPADAATPAASALASARTHPVERRKQAAALAEEARTRAMDAAARDRVKRALLVQRTFQEDLAHQLRRSPFWAVSGAVHLLIFFVLSMITIDEPGGPFDGEGTLRAELSAPLDELEVEGPQDEPEVISPAETDFAEMPEPPELEDPFELKSDPTAEDNDGPQLPSLPQADVTPVDIGLAPRLTTFRNRKLTSRLNVSKKALKRNFTKSQAESVNKRSADIVRGQLGLGRGGGRTDMPTKAELLVVKDKSSFDHIDRVLDALKIPYTQTTSAELLRGRTVKLSDFKILFWNCSEGLGLSAMRTFRPKLERWVRGGGFLFTTDWGVTLVEQTFPGYISSRGNRSPLVETVLHIQPEKDNARHPLLEGVFLRDAKGQWWLEQASFDIILQDRKKVDVLIEAPQLEKVFARDPAVAVTFRHGRGRVLHVMGHYFQKMGNLAGTIASHRLALNFVIERMKKEKKGKR